MKKELTRVWMNSRRSYIPNQPSREWMGMGFSLGNLSSKSSLRKLVLYSDDSNMDIRMAEKHLGLKASCTGISSTGRQNPIHCCEYIQHIRILHANRGRRGMLISCRFCLAFRQPRFCFNHPEVDQYGSPIAPQLSIIIGSHQQPSLLRI